MDTTVDTQEVELIFTAPPKPGHYLFTVTVRSDSYLGLDVLKDIKLEVCEAKEAVTEHPQVHTFLIHFAI